jgi:hypothetical protein
MWASETIKPTMLWHAVRLESPTSGMKSVSPATPTIQTSTITLIGSVETPMKSFCLACSTGRHGLETSWTLTSTVDIHRCTTLLYVVVDYVCVRVAATMVRWGTMFRVLPSNPRLREQRD